MISVDHAIFAVYVGPKIWHGDGGAALYLGVGAFVAPPLVAAFALVRYLPAVAFIVGLVAFNLFLLMLLVLAVRAFSHAIGYSSTPYLLHWLFVACCFGAYEFQLYNFYGARHSVTYVELENETNEADETDEEIGQPTSE